MNTTASAISGLIMFVMTLGFVFVVFIIIRQFVLWYWRLNEIANNLAFIADHFRKVEQQAEQRQHPPITPQQPPLAPANPFAPQGIRPRA